MAAFDLENTLIASNVVASYSWLATRRLPTDDRLRFVLKTLAEAPSLLALDRKDRGDFLRYFYRRYEGAPVEQLDEDAAEMFSGADPRQVVPGRDPARARAPRTRASHAADHRRARLRRRPRSGRCSTTSCARSCRSTAGGRYTGELTDVPPTGESRAQAMIDYADAEGPRSSRESVAYADSTCDLPMLEVVGFPVAVNPETRLAAIARKRGWLVEQCRKADGAVRQAPSDRRRRMERGATGQPPVPGWCRESAALRAQVRARAAVAGRRDQPGGAPRSARSASA